MEQERGEGPCYPHSTLMDTHFGCGREIQKVPLSTQFKTNEYNKTCKARRNVKGQQRETPASQSAHALRLLGSTNTRALAGKWLFLSREIDLENLCLRSKS